VKRGLFTQEQIDKMPAEQFALNGGGNGLVFTQEYIDRNPHVIDAVIRAVKDADAFINVPANFEEVTKITQQFFKFDMPKGDEILAHSLKLAIDANTYRFTARPQLQGINIGPLLKDLANKDLLEGRGKVVLDDRVADDVSLSGLLRCRVEVKRPEPAFVKAVGAWSFRDAGGSAFSRTTSKKSRLSSQRG
jgi:hypothetical protein